MKLKTYLYLCDRFAYYIIITFKYLKIIKLKKLLLIPILLFTIYSCSKDEETQAQTNSVQTTTPEKAVVKYTLTVTEANGGNVTGGGTYDDGTEISITATPNEGYLFVGWEPIDEIGNLYSQTISLKLNSDVEITPIFIMAVSVFQFNDIIIKRENNQSDCEYGGFKLTIGKDINSNKLIDEIIQEINFCNISDEYLTFDNIVSEYSRVPEIVWKNNQLHLQNGLNSSDYKTPIVSYLGPNTNPVYSNDLIDYDNAMAFWYRFEKLNTFHSFKFNFQDRFDAKNKMIATIPNFPNPQENADIMTQINCIDESCFGGANAGVSKSKNGYVTIRIKTPDEGSIYNFFSGGAQVHEITHSIHFQWLDDGPFFFEHPCWLIEGTAQYSGLSIGLKTYDDYIRERSNQMSGSPVPGLNPNNVNDLIEQFFNVFSGDSSCNFEGIYSLTYSVGLAVIEVLSTISGPDSIMMVWNLGKYGFSFEEAFESVYGISWDEAIPVLAEAVSKYSY
tara:strand:- start:470 stop:1981 length:1512 start_codon:yes stop_codon:yes gene_type:complete